MLYDFAVALAFAVLLALISIASYFVGMHLAQKLLDWLRKHRH